MRSARRSPTRTTSFVNEVVLVGDLRAVRIGQNIGGNKNSSHAEIVVVIANRKPIVLTEGVVHPAEYLIEILPIRPNEGDGPGSGLDGQVRQQIRYRLINRSYARREGSDVGL